LAFDFPLHLPAHADVTAAAIGAADFDSIDGGDYAPAGPVGLQDANSLQSLGNLATQIEDLGGILPLHRVTEHVLAEAANALAQCAAAALRLNPVKRAELAGGSQEDGVKNF
jgi:hypothetical protein